MTVVNMEFWGILSDTVSHIHTQDILCDTDPVYTSVTPLSSPVTFGDRFSNQLLDLVC